MTDPTLEQQVGELRARTDIHADWLERLEDRWVASLKESRETFNRVHQRIDKLTHLGIWILVALVIQLIGGLVAAVMLLLSKMTP